MNADRGTLAARRYLLGQASEEECAVIEREYFAAEAAVEHIDAVEEDLVEDYLANRLTADDRDRFEAHYLASPRHRTRVETIRRLSAVPADRRQLPPGVGGVTGYARKRSFQYLAIAAALLIAVGTLWLAGQRRPSGVVVGRQPTPALPIPGTTTAGSQSNQAAAPPLGRRIFAVSLSPIAVRSATESPAVVIPAGTDFVALQLEGDTDRAKLVNARVVIQTVGGDEIWRGSDASAADQPVNAIARFEVPAARLGVDDYVVVLFGTDSAGVEWERYRYVLRVRSS